MKYCKANTHGVPMATSNAPFKRVINNGYEISTQSDSLIKQLEDNERDRSGPVIDWHLFKPGETILIDNFGQQYACIIKTDGFVELQAIVGIKISHTVAEKLHDVYRLAEEILFETAEQYDEDEENELLCGLANFYNAYDDQRHFTDVEEQYEDN